MTDNPVSTEKPDFMTPEEINRQNRESSTGRVSDDGGSPGFYTASDVRRMTQAQVRANYERIILSISSGRFDE